VWVTLHFGSRGVGNKIGTHYIRVAQELCTKVSISLPDRDLAYLPEEHPAFTAYIPDLNWAQQLVGKEHPESFHSAPHGAGRRYSRTKARSLLSMDDLGQAMKGIKYRHSKVLLDEIPAAYKDGTRERPCRSETRLKQFVNVKGD
jgi:RNA-splicing ligase RtcB